MAYFMATLERERTVGRPKRQRAKGAGSGVKVKGHSRTPRGPDAGKRKVAVDGYSRGKPARRKSGKKRRVKRKS